MSEVKLSDFKVTGGEYGWDYTADYIATLKPNGSFDKKYSYVSEYWAGTEGFDDKRTLGWWDLADSSDEEHTFYVWEDEDFASHNRDNVIIPFTTGIAVYTGMSDVNVVFAGEVLGDDYGIPLTRGANTFTGLIAPVDMILEDLAPTGGEYGWDYTADYIATIKPNGSFDKKYSFVSEYWSGSEGFDDERTFGWWDLSDSSDEEHTFYVWEDEDFKSHSRNKVKIFAGQAFAVYTGMQNVELVVPSALP